MLAWAARLHEIGLTVSYGKYHRHGGYLLANADLPGFSRNDQSLLGSIVAVHRRKIDRRVLAALPKKMRKRALRLIVLLRLAVLLNRSRNPAPLPPFRLEEENGSLLFRAPKSWLGAHPLSVRDLASERAWLAPVGVDLALA